MARQMAHRYTLTQLRARRRDALAAHRMPTVRLLTEAISIREDWTR